MGVTKNGSFEEDAMFGIGMAEMIIIFIISALIIVPVIVVVVVLINVHGRNGSKIYSAKVQPPPLPEINNQRQRAQRKSD